MTLRFYHWDGVKLTSTVQEWGDTLPSCTDEVHHFRRSYCKCGRYPNIEECRMKQAVRESPEKLKEKVS